MADNDDQEAFGRKTSSVEEIIRDEMKETLRLLVMIWRTGLTILPAVVLGIFYLRNHFYQIMVDSGQLDKGDLFPWQRWIIGTFLLLILAFIFGQACKVFIKRYRWYKDLLQDRCSDALTVPPRMSSKHFLALFTGVFYLFPIFDAAIRIYFQLEVSIRINLG